MYFCSGVNITINAPSAPTLAATGNNPASCGADGSIDFIFTNVPDGSYTITYATGSFTNVNVSGGAATVTAPAGAYNNLEISVGTCTSVSGVNVKLMLLRLLLYLLPVITRLHAALTDQLTLHSPMSQTDLILLLMPPAASQTLMFLAALQR